MGIHIPPQSSRRWSGPYDGDYSGVLWKTFNVDLDRNEGKVCLSRRLTSVADTTVASDSELGIVDAFLRTNADCTDRYWALSSGAKLYRSTDSNPGGTWGADTLANSPTNARDMAVFENDSFGDTSRQQLFVTRDTDIAILNDTGNRVWTTFASLNTLKAGVPHPITYFPFRRILVVGDANRVHTISRISPTANETAASSRLVLPTGLQIQHIFNTTNRTWLLCPNVNENGSGKIVEWDGFSETYNAIHDAYSAVPLAGVNYREIPIIVTNRGLFLEFTGNGFAPMVRGGKIVAFPCYFEPHNGWWIILSNLAPSIRQRGMTVGEDGLIYIAAEQSRLNSFRQGGGIWCLNPLTGRLYLKHAIGSWANTSFGEQRTKPGALFSLPTGGYTADMLIGGTYNNNNVNFDRTAIWTLSSAADTTASRGYFITQYIHSGEVRDFWDTLWLKFQRFATSTNRIVVKARGVKSIKDTNTFPIEASIAWVNATSFTVTLAATDDALAVGDEVEIINGVNSGCLAHISAISGAHAAVQTITIDETLTASTNTARARFDRWKKLGTISSTAKYEEVVNIGVDSSFIQFKVELRGPVAEMEIGELVVNTRPSINAKR